MILKSIQKVKLYELLFQIDQDLAQNLHFQPCPFCEAPLHVSNYLRKPRGGPDNLPEYLLIRHSFCCSSESCRKRVKPVSCRFWDRKVYWGVVILVVMTLKQQRTNGYSAGKLMRLFGISRQTLRRWMGYFKMLFPLSDRWKRVKGHIPLKVALAEIPGGLVQFFIHRFQSTTRGLTHSLLLLSGGYEMV